MLTNECGEQVETSTTPEKKPARRGLTLMELVVVLTVLAALAALVLPLFPNLLRRAHKVSDSTQTSEVAKAVQLYQGLYLSYPNGYDLMVSSGGTFPTYVPNSVDDGGTFGGGATPGPLSAEEAAALKRVGISFGHQFATATTGADFHPTKNPYSRAITPGTPGTPADPGAGTPAVPGTDPIPAASTPLAAGTVVARINKFSTHIPIEMQNIIAADPTVEFVVFGVGPRCTAVGNVMQNAPTSVPQNKDFTPETLYSRVGVVFMIAGKEVAKTERARFIGAVALEDDELESTEKDLVGYYGVAAGERP